MAADKDSRKIIIIGGGVIGLCCAYYLLRRGCDVLILERGTEQRDNCSMGNAGMVVPSHFVPLAAPGMISQGMRWMFNPESPFYVKPRLSLDLMKWGWNFYKAAKAERVRAAAPVLRDLTMLSRSLFVELAAEWGRDFGLQQHGLIMLCKTEHGLSEEVEMAGRARELGIAADVHDAASLAKLDPGVTMDVLGGVHFPQDCSLLPGKFMEGLQSAIRDLGGRFVWNAEVKSFETDSSRVRKIGTEAGSYEADEFLLAGGAWSPLVAKMLRLNLPMQAGKGYSLTVSHPPACSKICSILTEARVAVTPMAGAMRFGGTMEISGLDLKVNPRRVEGIIKSAGKYYPQFSAENFRGIEPWRGLRPCSPDGMPYVGRFQRWSNLSVATGHSMLGLSLGPVTGQLMSEILTDEKPSVGLELLDPNRYL